MTGLIYIADDEKNIRELIESFLIEAGHEVRSFETGDALLKEMEKEEPNLVILDVMMPGTDGFSACTKIRKHSEVPIILLTARDTDADYITGFTVGCDDYFTKPFSPIKLTMRVNAILKREMKEKKVETKELVFQDIRLNQGLKTCLIKEEEVKLTNTEFELLLFLMIHRDRAVSREELLSEIWGYEAEVETRVTDDTIKRIRKKLLNLNSEAVIETVWGFGFKLGKREGV